MFNIGPPELFIIFVIILLVFGGKKIPEVARAMGKGMREFKRGMRDVKEDIEHVDDEDEEENEREQEGEKKKNDEDAGDSGKRGG